MCCYGDRSPATGLIAWQIDNSLLRTPSYTAQWDCRMHEAPGSISAVAGQPDLYGTKYEVDGILITPSGRAAPFRTVWMVRAGEHLPRFVTACPNNAR